MHSYDEIHKNTNAVYERHAESWDQHRPRSLLEKAWLDRLIETLPKDGAVLDVGCGAGEPIAGYLINNGLSVTGIDSSPGMIKICQSRFSDQQWLVMDMRELELEKRFDGIVAWDSFFHLKPDEQRSTLQRFCWHLNPGGALLLTVGHEDGEVLGTVAGEAVYHSSLSPEEYKQILNEAGFSKIKIVPKDKICDRTVLMASQKQRSELQ